MTVEARLLSHQSPEPHAALRAVAGSSAQQFKPLGLYLAFIPRGFGSETIAVFEHAHLALRSTVRYWLILEAAYDVRWGARVKTSDFRKLSRWFLRLQISSKCLAYASNGEGAWGISFRFVISRSSSLPILSHFYPSQQRTGNMQKPLGVNFGRKRGHSSRASSDELFLHSLFVRDDETLPTWAILKK
jgi:hypothetical protein